MKGKLVLYIDQYGCTYFARTAKELNTEVRGKRSRIYVDGGDGRTYYIGYMIGQRRFIAYTPVRIPV